MNIIKHIKVYPLKKLYSLLTWTLFAFLLVSGNSLNATHIVGGDITYKCLGFGDYEVTLTVRRDCQNGEEPFDNTAHVGIFDGYGNLLPWFGTGGMIQIQNPTVDTIDTSLDQGCSFLGNPVCVEEATYVGVVNLPKRESGYYFAYQRCCKNVTVDNIVDPLNTGSTFFVRLLEESMGEECNSSPTFNDWPSVYICANQTLVFDHSASDPEGDSLVYKLFNPFTGATFDNPQPVPPAGPPYVPAEYQAPYSFDDPMGGTPLTIDPNTGVLTALPNTIGQWLIGVAVEEYRDGELTTTVRRNFEYNTRICTEGPMAAFDVPSNPFCEGLEISVVNNSTDADSYEWTVNPSEDVLFDANAVNPTFTFPGNGVYIVGLEAFRDIDGCSTVVFDTVGVYDSNLEASFETSIESCATDSTTILLNSTSTDPDYEIVSWEWVITSDGFNTSATGEMVSVVVPQNDNVSITLVATSENGCTASVTQEVDADPLDLELTASPMMICQGDTIAVLVNPNCDLTYSISPLDYVIFDDEEDPCVISIAPLSTTNYTIIVTDGICTDSAVFMADVIDKADLSIALDSVSCDGTVKLWVNGGLEGNQFVWSNDPLFENVIGDMTDTLNYTMVDQNETIYVQVKEGTGCSNVATFDISNQTIEISYPESFVACTNSLEEIVVTNENPDHEITITWDENDIIESTTDSSVIILVEDANLETTITFIVTNQFGCTESGSIEITAEQQPELSFNAEVTCGSLEMCFNNSTTPTGSSYMWDFGVEGTEDDVSTEENPCYTYEEPGVYSVTLTIAGGPCDGTQLVQEIEVPVIPEIEIDNGDVFLCFGNNVLLTTTTNTEGTIEWTDSEGSIGEGLTIIYVGDASSQVVATITDEFGCSASDTIEVEVYIYDLTVNNPDIACVDEEITITVTNNTPGNDFSYDWEPQDCIVSGEGTNTVVVTASDTKEFSVFVTNGDNNCDTLITFVQEISVIDKSVVADPSEPYQCNEIEVFVTPDNDNCMYVWNTGETGSSITDTILQESTYTVTITDENGCTDVESLTVPVILPNCDETDVFIPNAFSPNNDGVNDIFIPRSNFIKEVNFIVYNRWGETVFETTQLNTGWDGTYNGDELAPDVYAYSLVVTCSNGEVYITRGNVTLLK